MIDPIYFLNNLGGLCNRPHDLPMIEDPMDENHPLFRMRYNRLRGSPSVYFPLHKIHTSHDNLTALYIMGQKEEVWNLVKFFRYYSEKEKRYRWLHPRDWIFYFTHLHQDNLWWRLMCQPLVLFFQVFHLWTALTKYKHVNYYGKEMRIYKTDGELLLVDRVYHSKYFLMKFFGSICCGLLALRFNVQMEQVWSKLFLIYHDPNAGHTDDKAHPDMPLRVMALSGIPDLHRWWKL